MGNVVVDPLIVHRRTAVLLDPFGLLEGFIDFGPVSGLHLAVLADVW